MKVTTYLALGALTYSLGSAADIGSTWHILSTLKICGLEEANPFINPSSMSSMLVYSSGFGLAVMGLSYIGWRYRDLILPMVTSLDLRDKYFSTYSLKYFAESIILTLICLPFAVGVGRLLISLSNLSLGYAPNLAEIFFFGNGHATTILYAPLVFAIGLLISFKLVALEVARSDPPRIVPPIFCRSLKSFSLTIMIFYSLLPLGLSVIHIYIAAPN